MVYGTSTFDGYLIPYIYIYIYIYIYAVPFQTVQFSISRHLSSIRPIDRIPSGAPTTSQSQSWVVAIKEHSAFPKAPALLKPHHQIAYWHIKDTRWESLTPQQRCSLCILQSGVVAPDRVLSMVQIELNGVFMLNWTYNGWYAIKPN